MSDRMHCGKQPWGWHNSPPLIHHFIGLAELRENVMAVTS
jgi:hypothetical protein